MSRLGIFETNPFVLIYKFPTERIVTLEFYPFETSLFVFPLCSILRETERYVRCFRRFLSDFSIEGRFSGTSTHGPEALLL
ncbi:hypothetical protein TSAR_002098 [Trichomalopsis sarcophagae]|uniref:Uncharacterized protein n=1 Tax=Trichomalopsis sarcophagae TaxID=543379 RepID=A0A232EJ73_9HYME|nr:hypothetical protein TSAR_002098 [Trichomalopsis sarcophagae]